MSRQATLCISLIVVVLEVSSFHFHSFSAKQRVIFQRRQSSSSCNRIRASSPLYTSILDNNSDNKNKQSKNQAMSTASASESSINKRYSVAMFQDKTVKELRDIAKDYPDYSSKLRLKKDLLKFLAFQQQQQQRSATSINGSTGKRQQQQQKAQSKKRIRTMPSYQSNYGINGVDNEEDDEFSTLPSGPYEKASDVPINGIVNTTTVEKTVKKSKKDILTEFVLERYPPLRPTSTDVAPADAKIKFDGVDMEDIRAQYHPMLTHLNKTSSDLELVLVGTASCCPSATRGVSCTAVRLNWRRNTGHGKMKHLRYLASRQHKGDGEEGAKEEVYDTDVFVNSQQAYPQQQQQGPSQHQDASGSSSDGTFEAGTWLFDCGECTQVRIVQLLPGGKMS